MSLNDEGSVIEAATTSKIIKGKIFLPSADLVLVAKKLQQKHICSVRNALTERQFAIASPTEGSSGRKSGCDLIFRLPLPKSCQKKSSRHSVVHEDLSTKFSFGQQLQTTMKTFCRQAASSTKLTCCPKIADKIGRRARSMRSLVTIPATEKTLQRGSKLTPNQQVFSVDGLKQQYY